MSQLGSIFMCMFHNHHKYVVRAVNHRTVLVWIGFFHSDSTATLLETLPWGELMFRLTMTWFFWIRMMFNGIISFRGHTVLAALQHGEDLAAQRVMNDLTRTLLGVKRADRHKTSDLSDRACVLTVNQIVVQQSAMAAWKTANGGPLCLSG